MADAHWTRLPEATPSRNEVLGFAKRTRRNLDFIAQAQVDGDAVHLVTQIVLSLLGIVIFPYERHLDDIGYGVAIDRTLKRLETEGWPHWNTQNGSRETKTLRHLLRHVRNATAHNNVSFDSESGRTEEVSVSFTSYYPDESWEWTGTIRADQLYDFCDRFLHVVEDYVG